jgi:hypothetical protein
MHKNSKIPNKTNNRTTEQTHTNTPSIGSMMHHCLPHNNNNNNKSTMAWSILLYSILCTVATATANSPSCPAAAAFVAHGRTASWLLYSLTAGSNRTHTTRAYLHPPHVRPFAAGTSVSPLSFSESSLWSGRTRSGGVLRAASKASSNPLSTPPIPHHHTHHHHVHNPILHQVEHRAKEKASIAVGQKLAEQGVERLAERAGERLAERTGERLAERAGERLAERTGERLAERAGERLAERAGERLAERTGERLAERAGERLAERAGERLAERTSERLAERAGERFAERTGHLWAERAGERLAERSSERIAERASERLAERAGERLAERAGERLAERAGERLATRTSERLWEQATALWNRIPSWRTIERGAERGFERVAERGAERIAERGVERIAERGAERLAERGSKHAAERGLERAAERGVERVAERAAERSVERSLSHAPTSGGMVRRLLSGPAAEKVALRVGRGVLITLPALGGVFALYLLRADIQRWREERATPPAWMFVGAGWADGLDALLHFAVAYAIWSHAGHDLLLVLEHWSMQCAIVSTVCAVLGELWVLRRQRRLQQPKAGHVKS